MKRTFHFVVSRSEDKQTHWIDVYSLKNSERKEIFHAVTEPRNFIDKLKFAKTRFFDAMEYDC